MGRDKGGGEKGMGKWGEGLGWEKGEGKRGTN